MVGYIYKIINTVNDKVYIGKTVKSLDERFKEHCTCVTLFKNKKYKAQTKLYKAMLKYGISCFSIHQVEVVKTSMDDLNNREKYWINFYNSISCGYNISPGGDGGPLFKGHHHTDESKSVMSVLSSKRRWFTDGIRDIMAETCPNGFYPGRTNINTAGINNPMYGKPAKNKGIPMSKESKLKLRESLKKLNEHRKMEWFNDGKHEKLINTLVDDVPDGYVPGRILKRGQQVSIYNLRTHEIQYFESMEEASKFTGISFVTIKKSCESGLSVKYNTYLCSYVNKIGE